MWQARHVRDRLLAAHEGIELEIVEIQSDGDEDLATPLSQMGSVGIFTQRLERALLSDRIDVAIHSLKDVPAQLAEGTVLAAFGEREDPRDVWFHRGRRTIDALPQGSVVATGSLRRRSQLLHAHPEFEVIDLRGNLDTRWRKFEEGQFDAMVLAAAGVVRLGWSNRVTEWVDVETLLPAVGQGVLGLQIREDHRAAAALLAPLDDPSARSCATAERSLLETVAGGCVVPLAGFCVEDGGALWLRARLGKPDGTALLRAEARSKDPLEVGRIVGEQLLKQGGAAIVSAAKAGG